MKIKFRTACQFCHYFADYGVYIMFQGCVTKHQNSYCSIFFHFSSKKDDFTRLNWNHFTNIFRNLFRMLADVKNSDLLVFLNARSRKWHKCSEIGSKRLLACVWSTLREENKLGRQECGINGALSGLIQFLTTGSPLKNEKYFLFHFKSSFRSQDIYVFVLNVWSC